MKIKLKKEDSMYVFIIPKGNALKEGNVSTPTHLYATEVYARKNVGRCTLKI